MIDFVLNVATNKNNVYYLIICTIIFLKKKKKKKKPLSFKLLSLKIMIPTKVVNTHTRGHFYIIRETKYFYTSQY
jgi:hypothetical protein